MHWRKTSGVALWPERHYKTSAAGIKTRWCNSWAGDLRQFQSNGRVRCSNWQLQIFKLRLFVFYILITNEIWDFLPQFCAKGRFGETQSMDTVDQNRLLIWNEEASGHENKIYCCAQCLKPQLPQSEGPIVIKSELQSCKLQHKHCTIFTTGHIMREFEA